MLHREYPAAASVVPSGLSRRRWLQLMGASFVLGGVAGCRWEEEKIAPFAVRPPNRTPGIPQTFATAHEVGGIGRSVVVTSFDGRPVKVEGNRQHPSTGGGTDVSDQAAILSLYDPDRSGQVVERESGRRFARSWQEFDAFSRSLFRRSRKTGGRGFFVLAQASSSPTRKRLQQELKSRFPQMVWLEYESVSRDNERLGTELACGRSLRPVIDIGRSSVTVCLDADPFGRHPSATQNIRGWADHRDPAASSLTRLYAIESQLSVTGSQADHRLPVRSDSLRLLTGFLENLVVDRLKAVPPGAARGGDAVRTSQSTSGLPFDFDQLPDQQQRFLVAVADDLVTQRGKSLLIAGPAQPADVHARIYRINEALGNVGRTVRYVAEPDGAQLPHRAAITLLYDQLVKGSVETLLILGANPVYDSPAEFDFATAIPRAGMSIHLGIYHDETARVCRWHLPQTHDFEAWNDTRSFGGTFSICQPLIAPLFNGRSSLQLLTAILAEDSPASGEKQVRRTFEALPAAGKAAWNQVLHDGYLPDSEFPSIRPELSDRLQDSLDAIILKPSSGQLEMVFSPDPCLYDGRFANNSWLQELPDPATKLTWDNAAILSPATADGLGLGHGDVAIFKNGNRSLEIPVYVLPGQAAGSIGLTLGYGRTAVGAVAGDVAAGTEPVGVNVSSIRSVDAMNFESGFSVQLTGKRYELATTQEHCAIDRVGLEEISGRIGELVREASLEEYRQNSEVAHLSEEASALWESPAPDDGPQWGMSIDLSRCVGCNACMVACQSENNIPVVGREQVLQGREMHWLRLDRYFTGDVDDPRIVQQPVACQHCENAPCEQVCPVAATVHSDDGLNDMVYNRCIGTRYCANNCPYKVRRFNFFDYQLPVVQPDRSIQQLAFNPEVTIRSRGVMEKCTYCVQRIRNSSIVADNEQRPLEDGEIQTACQQSCPAQAIQFGDLTQPDSRVAVAQADSRAYGMLAELNVQPRTKYLVRIRNLNPALEVRN